jgi:hypothetical protein
VDIHKIIFIIYVIALAIVLAGLGVLALFNPKKLIAWTNYMMLRKDREPNAFVRYTLNMQKEKWLIVNLRICGLIYIIAASLIITLLFIGKIVIV